MEEFYDLVERAVDTAFEENKFYFKAYDYLVANKIKRKQITEFIELYQQRQKRKYETL